MYVRGDTQKLTCLDKDVIDELPLRAAVRPLALLFLGPFGQGLFEGGHQLGLGLLHADVPFVLAGEELCQPDVTTHWPGEQWELALQSAGTQQYHRAIHRWRIVFNCGCRNTHRGWRTPIPNLSNTHGEPPPPTTPTRVSRTDKALFQQTPPRKQSAYDWYAGWL